MAKAKSSEQVLVVAGQNVRVTHETVSIEDVQLDPGNPRIRFQLRRSGKSKPTQLELRALIKAQPGYDGLQKTIRKAGGIYDPVIVRHNGTVVEGNTRVAVVKTLNEGMPNNPKWKTVPVTRLQKDVSEQSIALLMASYHVAGKNKWTAFAKAEQIHQLSHEFKMTPEQVADETRNMTPREVTQTLEAYNFLIKEVMPKGGAKRDESFLESKWSHVLEFVKNRELADMRDKPDVRRIFAKLLVNDQIQGQEVRRLGKVLKNPRARRALEAGGFKDGESALKKVDPTVESQELRALKRLTGKLGKMKTSSLEELKSDKKAQRILEEHALALNNLMKTIGMAGLKVNG